MHCSCFVGWNFQANPIFRSDREAMAFVCSLHSSHKWPSLLSLFLRFKIVDHFVDSIRIRYIERQRNVKELWWIFDNQSMNHRVLDNRNSSTVTRTLSSNEHVGANQSNTITELNRSFEGRKTNRIRVATQKHTQTKKCHNGKQSWIIEDYN